MTPLHVFFCACLLLMTPTPASAAEQRPLIVAHERDWPPMNFMDASGNISGYCLDYINAAAQEAGFSVVHKHISWSAVFSELAAGKCDIVAALVSIIPERRRTMLFSLPYAEVRQAVIVRRDSPIKKEADLRDKTLGAQSKTTGYFAARKIRNAKPKAYSDIGSAIGDLRKGLLDAVIFDDPTATYFALKKPEYAGELEIAFLLQDAPVEHYAFAVRKHDLETLELVNRGVKAVKGKGIEAELMQKWLGR